MKYEIDNDKSESNFLKVVPSWFFDVHGSLDNVLVGIENKIQLLISES